MDDLALDLRSFSRRKVGDARDLRLVFITQRQVQYQIERGVDAKLGEFALRGGGDL